MNPSSSTLDPAGCKQLLARYRAAAAPGRGTGLFRFTDIGDNDVYNIAAPFSIEGRDVIAGRVESRSSELAQIRFFSERGDGCWEPISGVEPLHGLQDPCITFVDGQLVCGGVRFPIETPSGEKIWRMDFHRGPAMGHLEPLFTGPDKMKDIRLAQMSDGRIAVMTRPQGAKGGRGTIGFFTADRLADITAERIADAPLIEGQCPPEEWCGANEIHLLSNGLLGILGHVACFDSREHRHYYPMVFALDPQTGWTSPIEIIATRSEFPPGPSKRPDLVDVVFSGGLIRHGDGTATLYAGLSDAAAGWLRITDPFAELEAVL